MSAGTVDFVLALVLLFFTLKGFITGFIRSVVTIVAVLAAWVLTAAAPNMTAFALRYIVDPHAPEFPLVVHIATFILVFAVVQAAGFLITGLFEKIGLGPLDKIAGLALGLATGVFMGCIPLFLIYAIPAVYHWAPTQATIKHSVFLKAYTPIVRSFARPPAKPRSQD